MVRWVIFSVAVVVVTAVATLCSTYLASGPASEEVVLTGRDKPNGPPGSAVVDAPLLHKFGTMPQQSDGQKEWTITNKGEGEVLLSQGDSTCSCTIANLKDGKTATLAPGESTTVTLNWNTKGNNGEYRQHASILIHNDPEHQKYEFAVEGVVRPPVVLFPADTTVNFATVSNDAPHPHEIGIASLDHPDMKITEVTSSNPEVIRAAVQPMTAEECKRMQVEKGSKLVLSIKPGAPIGQFNEEVTLTTDHPKKPKIQLLASGRLSGPITLSPDRVRLLEVPAKQGMSQTIDVWVRGQKTTKFTVDKKPKAFDVAIVPMTDSGTSSASRYRLTVTVPPGMPSGSIVDDIILKTDHPQAGELKIHVDVLVRAS
jgi:hypothetical protein